MQLVDEKIFLCPQAAYYNILNKNFDTDFKISKKDFLDVNNINSLWTLKKFRLTPKPFCGFCYFPRKNVTWSVSCKKSNEWIIEEV